MIYKSIVSACVGVGLFWASLGSASAACEQVTFSDVGWTDITATTAVSSVILDALGYETDIKLLSVPVTYASLAKLTKPLCSPASPATTRNNPGLFGPKLA